MEMEQNCGQETRKSQDLIVEPTSLDILQGRDRTSIRHTGNRCFRPLIYCSVAEYEALMTPTEKNKFFNAIVKSIQMSGGRFLRRQPDTKRWEEIDLKEAKEKVSHAYRDVMKMIRKRSKIREEDLSPAVRPYYISAEHFDWNGIVMNAESADKTSAHEVILEPTDLDILHGRDDFSIHHVGNKCFRTVIGCSLAYYVILKSRSDKSKFISAIVDIIHSSEGRFLHRRERGEGWEQDDIQTAKKMVGQALRDVFKKPEILNSSSLIHVPDLLYYYKTAYDFDWRGMIRRAQCLPSEMKNSSSESTDDDWEDDISLGSYSCINWPFVSSEFVQL